MADRCSASIIIGGTISAALLPELILLIKREGLSVDYDGPDFVLEDLVDGEPLMLCAHEVSWGTFEELERFCREQGLAYSRWNGACAGVWGCCRSVWRGPSQIGALPDEYDVSEDDQILVGEQLLGRLGSLDAALAHFAHADFTVPPLTISQDMNLAAPLQRATTALPV